MSRDVVESVLLELNENALKASSAVPSLMELAGKNEEGDALIEAFGKIQSCVAVLEKELRESPDGLYLRSSSIRDKEEIEFLKSRLLKKDVQLQRAKSKLRKKNDIAFEPGFAKSIDVLSVQKELDALMYKLSAVDRSVFAAVPKLKKVSKKIEYADDAMRHMTMLLQCCKLDGDKGKLKMFSESSFGVVRSMRELGLLCSDDRDRKALFNAVDEYESYGDLFISSLRRNGVDQSELEHQRNDCLKGLSKLLDVFPRDWLKEKQIIVASSETSSDSFIGENTEEY